MLYYCGMFNVFGAFGENNFLICQFLTKFVK